MIPAPPSWAPSATVEPRPTIGGYIATVPVEVRGVAVLTEAETNDPMEIANRVAELSQGRSRPLPKGCGVSCRRVVAVWVVDRWVKPQTDEPIDILTVGL